MSTSKCLTPNASDSPLKSLSSSTNDKSGKGKCVKSKPIRRRKTFTGCWTCRSRKIKCDLGRPYCNRCLKSNIKCEGYHIKLRWLTKNDEDNDNEHFQRRSIEFVVYPPGMGFDTYDEMNLALAKLHSPSFSSDETKVLGPFGVFQGVSKVEEPKNTTEYSPNHKSYPNHLSTLSHQRPEPFLSKDLDDSKFPDFDPTHSFPNIPSYNDQHSINKHHTFRNLQTATNHEPYHTSHIVDTDQGTVSNRLPDNILQILSDNNSLDGHFDLMGMPPHHSANIKIQADRLAGIDTLELQKLNRAWDTHGSSVSSSALTAQTEPEEDDSDLVMVPLASVLDDFLSTDYNLGLPTNSKYFSLEARQILHHYTQFVTPLMTFVTHESTPWKTIYLPQAVDAIGSLTVFGKASPAKNTILHAILSVGSYHLATKYAANSPQRKHFNTVGRNLKNKAIKLVKQSLSSPISFSGMDEEHKDMITAALSMVSTGVVSSQTNSSQFYIHQCRKFILRQMNGPPFQITKELRVLHRIYAFLSLLLDSTNVTPNHIDSSVFDVPAWNTRQELQSLGLDAPTVSRPRVENIEEINNSFSVPLDLFQGSSHKWDRTNSETEHTAFDSDTVSREASSNTLCTKDQYHKMEIKLTHSLYGIPDSLTLLFNRVVRLARQKFYLESRNGDGKTALKHELHEKNVQLGEMLKTWLCDFHETQIPPEYTNNYKKAFFLHTIAFYHAIFIYHSTLVCDTPSEKLQHSVRLVIKYLVKIFEFNADDAPPVLLPLTFPLFIASCEAVDEEALEQVELLFDKMTLHGLGTYTQTRLVVKEVWRRRSLGRLDYQWYQVVNDLNITLLLS